MNILVKNFPRIISVHELKRLFQKHGSVKYVTKEKFKEMAVVVMPHDYQARQAISELNGTEFFGKKLQVQEKD